MGEGGGWEGGRERRWGREGEVGRKGMREREEMEGGRGEREGGGRGTQM